MKMDYPSRVYILRDCLMQVKRELATQAPDLRKLQTIVTLALVLAEPIENEQIDPRVIEWDSLPSWKP